MTYWRMQVHPNEAEEAVKHTVESLSAGYIGLDFSTDIGDLKTLEKDSLPQKQKDYWSFAHEMAIGDKVLIFAHHYPLAMATVGGEYNYIRNSAPEIGVWFRHFRSVTDLRYYADFTRMLASGNP